MINFIEYMVSELKSKRLSKADALSLIKQFSSNSATRSTSSVIHPLLHINTSDLHRQTYTSTFSGKEFFLADHRIKSNKDSRDLTENVPILPGVAYLEMARIAVEQAMSDEIDSKVIELRNIVWLQPLIVAEESIVSIELFSKESESNESEELEFEIFSLNHEGEKVHCQGQVSFVAKTQLVELDLARLKNEMEFGQLVASDIYPAFSNMGLEYGPSHQAIKSIYKGDNQLLAEFRLPETITSAQTNHSSIDYFLHPSIMDAAFQATIGLSGDIKMLQNQPSLPFALESIRSISAYSKMMFAWIRYAPSSTSKSKITKLDIDLCDADGNICVQMRGFSSRVFDSRSSSVSANVNSNENTSNALQNTRAHSDLSSFNTLLATPVWKSTSISGDLSNGSIESGSSNVSQHHVILCDLPTVDLEQLKTSMASSEFLQLESHPNFDDVANKYTEIALACFDKIKSILKSKLKNNILVQVVISQKQDDIVFGGISGLLKTAALENPFFNGQVIFVNDSILDGSLDTCLQFNKSRVQDVVVRYKDAARQVLGWKEVQTISKPQNNILKDCGVYIITGGLGGLGVLFAKEILKQTKSAKIIFTGRSELTPTKKALLNSIEAKPTQLEYKSIDLANLKQVSVMIEEITQQYGQVTGVIHSAGMIVDNFILKKTSDEFNQVLTPKVTGTYNLDRATKNIDLDFFVAFSSGATAIGNSGQADYASANGFIDYFIQHRKELSASNKRHGVSLSINWPLWKEGGMTLGSDNQDLLQQMFGMVPMQTNIGIDMFYQAIASGQSQVLVAEGDLSVMRKQLPGLQVTETESIVSGEHSLSEHSDLAIEGNRQFQTEEVEEIEEAEEVDEISLLEKTSTYLRKQLSVQLKMPPHQIDPKAPLENYGIDSILAMNLTGQLENTFGSLPKTLFFEYQTISELAEYFVGAYRKVMIDLFSLQVKSTPTAIVKKKDNVSAIEIPLENMTDRQTKRRSKRRFRQQPLSNDIPNSSSSSSILDVDPIAIIGLSGRYPESVNIEQYWVNLRDGKDCVIEVPKERWDWQEYFTEDRNTTGHHFSKWGGFIEGVDEFDPLFFSISPREAELIDPQERLFLQHSWMAVEDAGYTRASLQIAHDNDLAGQVGVYVGVMYGEYQLFGAEASVLGERAAFAGNLASIANRVSYVLNLHGPSMTLDTMCSSSLTSIHLACQDLKTKRTSLAIAGGVNVSVHPNKYLMLSAGQFISSDGHCQSFGEGGDGYIPGEGVGVVVLKRLSEAEKDGNSIYGIIKGSSLNHGGKTNGYTVPNPQAQASAISRALIESNTDPRHISYIEAHGTGTKLGDPIEIAALSKAFNKQTQDKGFCLIGSAKSNIGHCESAAGIAGLTKVLLQMKHKQIVPSLHSTTLNPHIDFPNSPFIVNQKLKNWERPVIDNEEKPLIAGISSFGAGGSNAHVIVQEYFHNADSLVSQKSVQDYSSVIILLSARTTEQLEEKATDVLAFISSNESAYCNEAFLQSIAYTLQVGREAMEERLALVVDSIEQLTTKLNAFINGEIGSDDVYQGQVKNNVQSMSVITQDEDMIEAISKWIARKKWSKLADLWVKGLTLDWSGLYLNEFPKLISLPTYPFAKEKYWISKKTNLVQKASVPMSVLHPLLHANTSDLGQQSYSSTFTGNEFFLSDHLVSINNQPSQKILPAVVYLEMARAAVERAVAYLFATSSIVDLAIELRNIVWLQPIIIVEDTNVTIALFQSDSSDRNDRQVDYEIYSQYTDDNGQEREVIHCRGHAIIHTESHQISKVDLALLNKRMDMGTIEPEHVYKAFSNMGLKYGPTHRAITIVSKGKNELVAKLNLPNLVECSDKDYVLHPSIMDSAFQASIGLFDELENLTSSQASIPFALESINILSRCKNEMFAWVRYSEGFNATDKLNKLDVDLLDSEGNVCVQILALSTRKFSSVLESAKSSDSKVSSLMLSPSWLATDFTRPLNSDAKTDELNSNRKSVLLFGLPDVKVKRMARLLPSADFSLLNSSKKSIDLAYAEIALSCFERIQVLLKSKSQEKIFLQIAVSNSEDKMIYAGLSGLLKTAKLENPRFDGQIIFCESNIKADALADRLEHNQQRPNDMLVKYIENIRYVHCLKETEADFNQWDSINLDKLIFTKQGVYIITGGLGGLGIIFAKEIISKTPEAKIIFTGRSVLTDAKRAIISDLTLASDSIIDYEQLDLNDMEQVNNVIAAVVKRYGKVNGIIHSAGMTSDSFILTKTAAEFSQVLLPKVTGTFNLDQASKELDLDFMVLFSSIASSIGNLGQADYASANGFMDHFSVYRNQMVSSEHRKGKTVSINWPLWRDGGMELEQSNIDLIKKATGMHPMTSKTGLRAFNLSLSSDYSQVVICEGDVSQIRGLFFEDVKKELVKPALLTNTSSSIDARLDKDTLKESTLEYLSKQFSELFKIPSHKIDTQAPLENYGIDSVLAMNLTNQLENSFGTLSKTLFFEYQTITELTEYFLKSHREELSQLFAIDMIDNIPLDLSTASLEDKGSKSKSRARFSPRLINVQNTTTVEPIAIIGLSGRYPNSINIDEYWSNLRDGQDCIIEVPTERWNWKEYYSDNRSESGHHYSKWGGFIAGVDEFDPLFFNISPIEAESIDPQERLFLQHAWMAVEDAGYTRNKLQIPDEQDLPGQVGVYVGVMYSEYQLFGQQTSLQRERKGVAGSFASIANRVSYVLNLHGPSMTMDTMCSSSLTSIHTACQDLKLGRTSLAIAGGVNVSIHPNKYLVLSAGQFISSDGHCQSFGEGGDGYIPGEGVGAVVLKRLSEAKRDRQHIYGVIKGTALSHGGKTNGATVPNPQAQASAISRALIESKVDPRSISYIEAHGTGTKLGDPIEISALSNVFQKFTQETGFCSIGSAKSNIGHCESAAGIAGLTKVLLQMKHQKLVPSLHSTKLNPNIDFAKSPFVVNQTLKNWDRPTIDGKVQPRLAGISSFGAGGSNAHIIVEEYVEPNRPNSIEIEKSTKTQYLVPLSARNEIQLTQKTNDLLSYLQNESEYVDSSNDQVHEKNGLTLQSNDSFDLEALAYTLQVGREPMEERLGFLVTSIGQLIEKIIAFSAGEQNIEDVYFGQVRANKESMLVIAQDDDMKGAINQWLARKKLTKLLDLWVKGLDVDWNKLYGDYQPATLSLPAYPFAKEKYWIDLSEDNTQPILNAASLIHPMLHVNTSDMYEQSYSSNFTGSEFFLAEHLVSINGKLKQKMLPAVAYLEMIRVAVCQAMKMTASSTGITLHNTNWSQPIIVNESTNISVVLHANQSEQVDYQIISNNADEAVIHCQGQAHFGEEMTTAMLDLKLLKQQMQSGELSAEELYSTYSAMGIHYGISYQGVKIIYRGNNELLAALCLPPSQESNLEDYVLHPSMLDSAMQASMGLLHDLTKLSSQPLLPFALDSMCILSHSTSEMFAWIRFSKGSHPEDRIIKLDIDLCDNEGNVCVQLHGFSSRVLHLDSSEKLGVAQNGGGVSKNSKSPEVSVSIQRELPIHRLIAKPEWKESSFSLNRNEHLEFSEVILILCEKPEVKSSDLKGLITDNQVLHLQSDKKTLAERYREYAIICFEKVKEALSNKSQSKILVQLVINNTEEQNLFAGISGLLKTAAQENPKLLAQTILIDKETSSESLIKILQSEKVNPQGQYVKYENDSRYVSSWRELDKTVETTSLLGDMPCSFKDNGVYMITGGLGGLGLLFAKEILKQTKNAKVVITGRSSLSAEIKLKLEQLDAKTKQVVYMQLDITSLESVNSVVTSIIEEYKQLNGIIHSAGMNSDSFIVNKSVASFTDVMLPKVDGTFNLDQASQTIELDFLALFSSIAGAKGNAGQADYATANGFMDQFSNYRNNLVEKKQRHGQTISINWPLWLNGGMGIDKTSQALLLQKTGMHPMQVPVGIQSFYHSLESKVSQVIVAEGSIESMRKNLLEDTGPSQVKAITLENNHTEVNSNELVQRNIDFLSQEFSVLLKLPAEQIDPKAALEIYGIDSVLAMSLTNQLEKTFGSLSKTLFFEYQTIGDLAKYFTKNYPSINIGRVNGKGSVPNASEKHEKRIKPTTIKHKKLTSSRFITPTSLTENEVAIVGLSGRYPQADNLEDFWFNLKNGQDCITEIPTERWDHKLYFDPNPNMLGKSYSKWGGFMNDVDKFDPLFFNVSPKEAELIDPQERLFLETVWQTIEDAGYCKNSFSESRVGVFVGVMWGQYELLGAESIRRGNALVPGSSFASIANRISYFFDFHGPSIALDTMCSSSLTAIHLASEDIRRGNIDVAVAGGVNVSVHPQKYLALSQGKFQASDGKCRSFGEGGDGYVPGEGVGAVLLKPLAKALFDNDQVYGVIKSSSINHGGKTNGYTVPNPNAQAELILASLNKAKINPRTLDYIETHGTGTSLGDPIEIAGLIKAFDDFSASGTTQDNQYCPIGSVKSNIGHLESAAGIAAVTKALLQIKHKQLVPSLHADPLNPNIDFEKSPFYVQSKLTNWEGSKNHPRRVGVSSFGAGGSNSHLIIEEYIDYRQRESNNTAAEAFVISAKKRDALVLYAERMVAYLENHTEVSLTDMAYTSQVGRTPMDERLVLIVTSLDELKEKLEYWLENNGNKGFNSSNSFKLNDIYQGNIKHSKSNTNNLIEGEAGNAFLHVIVESRDWKKIAKLWIAGVNIDWSLFYQDSEPRRISLPTYPFQKERYWMDFADNGLSENEIVPVINNNQADVVSQNYQSDLEIKKRMYYSPKWNSKALDLLSDNTSNVGSILVLSSSIDLINSLNKQFTGDRTKNPIVWVEFGCDYSEKSSQHFIIDASQEEHFVRLLDNLKQKNRLPAKIVHQCLETAPLSNGEYDFEKVKLDRQLAHGLFAVFYLCKAIMKQKQLSSLKILSLYCSYTKGGAPLNASVSAFYKSLMIENPRYLAKLVEFSSKSNESKFTIDKKASLILDELYQQEWSSAEIRYQYESELESSARYIKELIPFVPQNTEMKMLPIRQNGVYVITGGLGGLGFVFSQYLVKNFQAKLVLLGRSKLNEKQLKKLELLRSFNADVIYIEADVSKFEDMQSAVQQAKTQFTVINGVIHSAGVNKDSYILKKDKHDIELVLQAKVFGTVNLDQATKNEKLDLFLLFSSIAGTMGNVGQSDYAFGNQFLDSFAENREYRKKQEQCYGKTLSINWPFWENVGMNISQEHIVLAEKQTGMCPLNEKDGIKYLEDFLQSELNQGIALYGIPSKLNSYTNQADTDRTVDLPLYFDEIEGQELLQKTQDYLKRLIGDEIKLEPELIDIEERFETFGIDSVMINSFNARLEADLGGLPKTLIYEYETIHELSNYLVCEQKQALCNLFGSALQTKPIRSEFIAKKESSSSYDDIVSEDGLVFATTKVPDTEQIAIIGIHSQNPQSTDLYEYWNNLKAGKDLIETVPLSRWDSEKFYDADPTKVTEGKIYCKWGGFLNDYDKFDASFFNITPTEARVIDPQERIFLESVWAAIEDSGYTPASLKKLYPRSKSACVGVFAGVTTNSYHLLASEEWRNGNMITPGAMPWSIANRVSYFFDFQGPSMPIDTACSSSLVAIHLACESLRQEQCKIAIAGGVNLYLHYSKYHSFCQKNMLAVEGKCRSFGAGDDGFVPAEGVGSVVLKALDQAIEDRDHIYAVIRGSAFDHSGRSNGYTAPNPNSQASLISKTLEKSGVTPDSISYVEGHGTGTQLGDSLEIAALTNAFRKQTDKKQFCSIGSVKANIGHSESVAGIAGLAKVLLQLKYKQLVPSIHSKEVNPNINFDDSPFKLQHDFAPWESFQNSPRRALINSFGAGGVNACLVLEEYENSNVHQSKQDCEAYLLVLSAKNSERLINYVKILNSYLKKDEVVDLRSLTYTLQVGREAMSERLALVISNRDELIELLNQILADTSTVDEDDRCYRGYRTKSSERQKNANITEPDVLNKIFEKKELNDLAKAWVKGAKLDWENLYIHDKPSRMSLPTYPFARERHWVSDEISKATPIVHTEKNTQLHPLVSYNSSTLKEVSFSSRLSENEFYSQDHKVNNESIFPGAGFLEIACISGNIAGEERVVKIKDIVWIQPLIFNHQPLMVQTFLKTIGEATEFEVISFDENSDRVVHSEGRLFFQDDKERDSNNDLVMPIEDLMSQSNVHHEGSLYYKMFEQFGFDYGSTFKTIQNIYVNDNFALAELSIAESMIESFEQYILHPSIIDGALQTVIGLSNDESLSTPYVPFALDEIEIIRPLSPTCYAYAERVEQGAGSQSNIKKFNITLLNERGETLIKLNNFYVRALVNVQFDNADESKALTQ